MQKASSENLARPSHFVLTTIVTEHLCVPHFVENIGDVALQNALTEYRTVGGLNDVFISVEFCELVVKINTQPSREGSSTLKIACFRKTIPGFLLMGTNVVHHALYPYDPL